MERRRVTINKNQIPRKSAADLAMRVANSLKLMTPSPLVSASCIISDSSLYVRGCPIFDIDPASSAAVIYPLPSLSNDRNTSMSCPWLTNTSSFMSGNITSTSSSNSTNPFPLASMLASKSWSWSPVGLIPRDLRRAASSRWVRLPSESMSKRMKMSFSCLSWSDWSTAMIMNSEKRNKNKERKVMSFCFVYAFGWYGCWRCGVCVWFRFFFFCILEYFKVFFCGIGNFSNFIVRNLNWD